MHINNSPQIPLEKRIDVSLPPPSDPSQLTLEVDEEHAARKNSGTKHLLTLMNEVPHLTYNGAKESQPSLVEDIEPLDSASAGWSENSHYPPHFLTPDDIDNYLYTIDRSLNPAEMLPTLAPLAHPGDHPPVHPALQNPNSSINWLRRHAPHIFLQGGHEDGHEEDKEGKASGARPRKPRKSGAAKETKEDDKPDKPGKPEKHDKHDKAAALAAASGHDADSMDDDTYGRSTPVPKGKRKRDDDPGYRPKGGSSRPTKKKRKSEGEAVPKRAKKESLGSKDTGLSSRD